jgi:hypothetical protein
MARRAPRDRTENPLPEARVDTCGVFYQGGFCYIYLERGEQPITCSDTRPNLRSIICRICAKGYLVGQNYNPGRLLRDDNGYFKVLPGNRHTIQGHTSRTSDTTTDVQEKPEGGILVPMHLFRIDLRTKQPPADTTPDTHHATSMSSHGSS